MGFLPKKKRTVEELEEQNECLTLEADNASKEAEIAEREAIIAELKGSYGKNWAKTLGVSKFSDLSTLRSFLTSAKQGLVQQAGSFNGIMKA